MILTILRAYFRRYYWVYLAVAAFFIGSALLTTRTVDAMAVTDRLEQTTCIVIDPGHGGEDGGATSCTGLTESRFNLEISLRLNDLFHLMGYDHMVEAEELEMRGYQTAIMEKMGLKV